MYNELELRAMEGLEQLTQVGKRMEALKASFLTGAPLSPLRPPPKWSVLRERIARLTAGNERTRNLAEQIGKLVVKL
jgi:hypothetical protein